MSPLPFAASFEDDRGTVRRPSKRRRVWSIVLGVASLALLATAVAGAVSESAGILLVDPVTRHRHALVLAGLAAGLSATMTWRSRKAGGAVVRGVLMAALMVALLAGFAWAALMSGFTESRQPSPDGSYVLVVSEGAAMIDPLWEVSVRESSWLLARTSPLACFNGDAPGDELGSVSWVDDKTVEAVAGSGEVHRITIGNLAAESPTFVSVGCDGLIGIP